MNAADVSSAVHTITHIGRHFEELKQSVTELAARVAAQNRGYFTPTEEEETLGLLVSYWQSRAALLELIAEFQAVHQLSDTDRPSAFLPAFAGALLLIDAARFLRERVHDKMIVREKLNQEAPEFGIPANVYDTVQESLLKTKHAWHLYHAGKYFQEQESQLRDLTRNSDMEEVLAMVDRLRGRLDVSLAQLARTKLRARISHTVRHVFRASLHKALYGLQKMAGNMAADVYVRPKHQPQLPAAIADRLCGILEPGDVLIVRKEYALTNYFLPGYWPHAALYLGHTDELRQIDSRALEELTSDVAGGQAGGVIESKKDGVRVRSMASPFASDSIVVLRTRLSQTDRAAALARALRHQGKPYDFTFDFSRSDQLVCTEVVYRAYDGVGDIRVPLIRRAGRPTLAGQDLLNMAISGAHFDPVAVFDLQTDEALVTGDRVKCVIEKRCRPEQVEETGSAST